MNKIRSLFRDFLCLWAWALPLCCLFTLLNPALILFQQDLYPLPLVFWLRLMTLGVAVALFLALFFTLLEYLIAKLQYLINKVKTQSQSKESIFSLILGATFIAFFCITVFYPQTGAVQDGSKAVEPSWSEVAPLYVGYVVFLFVLIWFGVKQRKLFQRLTVLAAVFSLAIVGYVATMTTYQHYKIVALYEQADISFGNEKNIIVIVADMLQGSIVEQAFIKYPELKEKLSDFTVYTKAISPFPLTSFAFPALLSGKTYVVNKKNVLPSQLIQAAKADSFITDAQKQGYSPVSLGTTVYSFDDKQINYSHGSAYHASITAALYYISLGTIRIFKKILFSKYNSIDYAGLFIAAKKDGLDLLKRLSETPVGNEGRKIFVIHNLMTHEPILASKEGDVELKFTKDNIGNATDLLPEIVFFIKALENFIEHLKTIKVYDESLIIVLGDHGHLSGFYNKAFGQDEEPFKGQDKGYNGRRACMYNPAVLIKAPTHKGNALTIKHDTISSTDTRQIIQNIAGGHKANDNFGVVMPENGYDIVMFPPNPEFNEHNYSNSHVLMKFKGNANGLVQFFFEPGIFEDIKYTKLEVNKILPLIEANIYGGFIKEPPSGAWIHGDKGVLALDFSAGDISRDIILSLSLTPLVNQKHPMQRIQVDASGVELSMLSLTTAGKQKIDIRIPKDVLQKNKGKIMLALTALDAVTPKSIGAWDYDATKVSILVRDLTLEQD